MQAIAGSILINGACVLMATSKDTLDVYVLQRILMVVGVILVVTDLYNRVREALKKAKSAALSKSP